MLDLAEQVVKGRPYRVADFTSPAGLVIADAIKANYPQLIVKTDGGYEGAERIRIAFVDSDFNGTVDMGIRALKVNWDPRFRLLTHRDVLGSLMGLGIDRSKFGDVIVQQGGAQIMVDESVADFVIQNFTKIAMVSVSVEAIELSDIAPKEEKIKEASACKQLLIDTIKEQMQIHEDAYEFEHKKSVLLLIGVNGVGKTTSVGKLAGQFKNQGKKVMLAAADTFRAGAIDQLKEWANRAGVDIIAGQEGSDPAAIVYDAVAAAKARDVDILLCDTAGRLHNKKNLMAELHKIHTIIEKEYPEALLETMIVVDGTTGQNALAQAKEFSEVADVSGVILTKLDGTAKGGIAIAIQSELSIPVKYIGIGEQIGDLQRFDAEEFVNALFEE